jgi:5-formyltetrahydrofolate cyclo-ligase
MLYLPLPDEPDLTPAIARLLASGRVVAVPRVDWTTGAMVASRITAWPADDATGFETTKHMLQQPGADAPTLSAGDIGLIVVPGVAFDDQGGRVGRGKGFYDRFLKGIRERGVLTRVLGVCFGCQVVAQVPTEPHDARVDEVLTDRGFLGVRRPAFKPT